MTTRRPPQPAAIADYRRLTEAAAVLTELAAGPDGEPIAGILAGDVLVLARMRAARAVLADSGPPVQPIVAGDALLSQAARWQDYATGPVSPLHRDCATDVVRGLLRLWARRSSAAGAAARPGRPAPRRARVELAGLVRSRCAALRVELREHCAAVSVGDESFRAEVMRRVAQVLRDVEESVAWTLGQDPAAEALRVDPPPLPRPGGPELRLTLLVAGGFGAGAALAVARVLGDLLSAGSPAAVPVSAAVGLLLGGWVARIRRQIARRAGRERWAGDVAATVRAALDEHVAARILVAEDSGERRR